MTVSTSLRYPLSAAHNRKRRPALPLQAHIVKPKSVVNFVTAIEVTPASSAEMSVSPVMKHEPESSSACFEDQLNAIFRESSMEWGESRDSAETDERQDFWSLKRASPIMEEDDEEESFAMESPSKKSKVETIYWDTQLLTDKPFDLSAMMRSS